MKHLKLAAFIAVFFLSSIASAKDKEEKKSESYTGTISVSKDDKGKVESITFETGGKKYKVATTGKGKGLAKDGEGETVEITGKPTTKKDRKTNKEEEWMNVTGYKVVFKGSVSVEKDDKGKVVGITIGSHDVKVDSKAKKMAEKAEGKEVVAEGSKITKKVGKGKEKEEKTFLVIKKYTIQGESEEKDKKKE